MKRPPAIVAARCVRALAARFSEKAMVDFGSAEDTLIATVLSARTRDEQVVRVYAPLRKRFPHLEDLANATQEDLERVLGTIGLFRMKAKAIRRLARQLIDRHGGVVPKTMEELVQLPGVGRKTASCVLWYAFGIPAIAVDTHVFRIVRRLGWASGSTPHEVEEELKNYLPRSIWGEVNRVFVLFGRAICRSGAPRCSVCPARDICAYARLRGYGNIRA